MVTPEGRDMAEFEVDEEVVRTVKGVTLTLSAQEAASLMHLLYSGVGGHGTAPKGPLGGVLTALKAAFGKEAYEDVNPEIEKYSGITIKENCDYGYAIADIRKS